MNGDEPRVEDVSIIGSHHSGMHFDFRCPSCGKECTVSASQSVTLIDEAIADALMGEDE